VEKGGKNNGCVKKYKMSVRKNGVFGNLASWEFGLGIWRAYAVIVNKPDEKKRD